MPNNEDDYGLIDNFLNYYMTCLLSALVQNSVLL
jgi:hypothetical protein